MVLALPHEDAGIRSSVGADGDVPELIELLALTSTEHDPPAVALGITVAEFETFVTLIAAPEATRGLTVVARDIASGMLVGALLTEDVATPLPDGREALSDKFDPIFGLFGQLDDQLADAPVTEPGVALHLFLLGVDSRFQGRGIARRLVQATLSHGAMMGYTIAVTEATDRTSQHIFRTAGFSTRAHASYADDRHDRVAVFAPISEHGAQQP